MPYAICKLEAISCSDPASGCSGRRSNAAPGHASSISRCVLCLARHSHTCGLPAHGDNGGEASLQGGESQPGGLSPNLNHWVRREAWQRGHQGEASRRCDAGCHELPQPEAHPHRLYGEGGAVEPRKDNTTKQSVKPPKS